MKILQVNKVEQNPANMSGEHICNPKRQMIIGHSGNEIVMKSSRGQLFFSTDLSKSGNATFGHHFNHIDANDLKIIHSSEVC